MGDARRYAQVTEPVIAVKKGAAPVIMKDKIFPVVSEDATTGNITVQAEDRKILLDGKLVRILSETEADSLRGQEAPL